MPLGRVGGSWFAHPLSRSQINAPNEQTREDFTVVGRSDWGKREPGPGKGGKAPVLSRVFSLLERAAVLRSARCSRTTLAEHKVARCRLFQGADPGGRRVRSFAKALRASITREAQPALAACHAFVSAITGKSDELRAVASRAERQSTLPAFEPLRRR